MSFGVGFRRRRFPAAGAGNYDAIGERTAGHGSAPALSFTSLGVGLAALIAAGPAGAVPQLPGIEAGSAAQIGGPVRLIAERRAVSRSPRAKTAGKRRSSAQRIAEQNGDGSLNQELATLLLSHPQLLASRERVKAEAAGVREAWGAYFPQVNVNGNVGHARVDSPARRQSPGEPFRGGTNSVAGELRLNVFDGFGKYANLSRARLQKIAAELELEAQLQQNLFRGVTAYINVRRQTALLALAQLSERTIMRQLRLEDERVRRGSGLSVDVLQAKSRLQIAKQLRVQVEGERHIAISRYIQVFGHPPRFARMSDPMPPSASLPPTLERALGEAKTDNPVLKKAERDIDIAEQRRKQAEAAYFPRIDLVIEGRRDSGVDGIPGIRRDYTFLVKMTWELFNGFANQSRVIRAARLRSAAQNDHRYVFRQVEDEARIAWHRLRTERQREELLANAINIAEAVFRSRQRLRAAGKETVINVLDAENEVNQARIQHTAARYDAMLAVYRLHFTLGQLTPATLALPQPKAN